MDMDRSALTGGSPPLTREMDKAIGSGPNTRQEELGSVFE